MSNTYQEWDDEEDVTPMNESELLKQLRKELKVKSKQMSEMESKLSDFEKGQRESVIKSVLESKGVNPKIAKFIPSDIETSPEVIGTWIDENADVFGVAVPAQENKGPNLGALRSIDAITANAQTLTGTQDVLSQIQNANEEELLNMIHAAGGGYGS
jgi:hypothetical protein